MLNGGWIQAFPGTCVQMQCYKTTPFKLNLDTSCIREPAQVTHLNYFQIGIGEKCVIQSDASGKVTCCLSDGTCQEMYKHCPAASPKTQSPSNTPTTFSPSNLPSFGPSELPSSSPVQREKSNVEQFVLNILRGIDGLGINSTKLDINFTSCDNEITVNQEFTAILTNTTLTEMFEYLFKFAMNGLLIAEKCDAFDDKYLNVDIELNEMNDRRRLLASSKSYSLTASYKVADVDDKDDGKDDDKDDDNNEKILRNIAICSGIIIGIIIVLFVYLCYYCNADQRAVEDQSNNSSKSEQEVKELLSQSVSESKLILYPARGN